MKKSKIIYIIGWYEERNLLRREELRKCIRNVCEMGEVDEIWIICERGSHSFMSLYSRVTLKLYSKAPIRIIDVSERPTYDDFFNLANQLAKQGDVVIIANTDIYPSDGVRGKLIVSLQQNDCYALSRYNVKENHEICLHEHGWDSQDVWIFRAPIRNIDGDFFLGQLGCDNAIAQRIYKQGYNIQNPSRSIQFNHLHNSEVRNYSQDVKVPKPYLLIPPHFLGEKPDYCFIDE